MSNWLLRGSLTLAVWITTVGCDGSRSGSEGNEGGAPGVGGQQTGGAGGTGGDGSGASGGSDLGGSGGTGGAPPGGSGGATATGGTSGSAGASMTGGTSGGAGASGTGGTSGGAGASGTGGTVALANPAPGTGFFVGANFWRIDWEGPDDFFQSGVDFATVTDPYNPQLLSDLAPYHALRFMDWNLCNNSDNPQADWSTRKQQADSQTNEPIAFEWQIDLCNRTGKDYWVAIPFESDSSYWQNLAQLILAELDPTLRVYVEFSNEVWNGGFPQHDYAATQAGSLGLPGDDPAAAWYVYASVRVYEAFEAVFGAGNPRLVKVLSGQSAWNGPCGWHVAALQNATINPNGTLPDVYAVAPYVFGTSMTELQDNVAGTAQRVADNVACAQGIGLPVISYEGGTDSFAGDCTTLQHDPGMRDLYIQILDALVAAGMTGPFMHYTHVGACWGLKERTSDSLGDSPKYQGVLDWLAAHP
jgi:hypothetical protein